VKTLNVEINVGLLFVKSFSHWRADFQTLCQGLNSSTFLWKWWK